MSVLDGLIGFETRPACHQNALDLFGASWTSRFPAESGLVGGEAEHFNDSRVPWGSAALGGLGGRSVLELGPFEAYNTYQFQMAGAAPVVSIEASRVNFLRCLVVKNIFGLNATFLHGDFETYLATTPTRFDICWASGVLYHLTRPIEFLRGVRRVADSAFIWTQYFDEAKLREGGNLRFFEPARDRVVDVDGRSVVLHHRNYGEPVGMAFSGGEEPFSYWMTRDDLMFVLRSLGYTRFKVGVDNPDHPPGPAMFFTAEVETEAEAQDPGSKVA